MLMSDVRNVFQKIICLYLRPIEGKILGEMSNLNLFGQIKRNSDQALKELYTDVFPNVRKYVEQNSGQLAQAEDIFQDAVVVLWQKIQYDEIVDQGDEKLKSLLYLICQRRWLDYLRSSVRKQNMASAQSPLEEAYESTESDQLDSHQIRLRWQIFEKLDPRCQEILKDFYLHGLEMKRIAEKWKLGYDTMKTTKYRCLEKAKKFSSKL